MYTIAVVFCTIVAAGAAGVIPGGMNLPSSATGWGALAALGLLYTTAFSVLFVYVPRLDMVRNAPVMNNEPRSEAHTSELKSLMRNSYAVFCLKKKHTK